MNNVHKLAVTLSLGALFASPFAFAAKPTETEAAYVASYRNQAAEIPAPLSVVAPEAVLSSADTAASVDVAFTVDTNGKPTDIKVTYASDDDLVEPVTKAVSRWVFAPAVRNGERVPAKVLLPVRFVVASSN